jgi:diaminohydroxyphosphoribosylaminopyrimidine deaminase/5-amino-6-(5-phosphoribosylamino)uracil reductase
MQHALRLARRGLGQTWPNPSVGAAVVRDGAVVGTGATGRGGRPHAETEALAMAGGKARGATLYVTLEPCAHHGQTPPCTDAIIAAGIARVVAASTDPNPKVSGKGFAKLRAAGIPVEEGVCEQDARMVNEGFFSVITRARPFVTLKTATSLDGKIATSRGESRWITGEESRQMVHALRASHDALLTGIGTVLADDPEFTCRLPGRKADSPQRVVLDSGLLIPPEAKLLPCWIFTSEKTLASGHPKIATLKAKGASLFAVPLSGTHLSLPAVLAALAQQGVTRLMVETGGTLAGEMVRQNLVDRLYWFRAPLIIGENGMPALRGQDSQPLAALPRFTLRETARLGDDVLEIYDCGVI